MQRYYWLASGLYGFARSANAQLNPPDDVIGKRLVFSLVTGILYSTPVLAQYYQLKLLNRIHIVLSERDPSLYKDEYTDIHFNPNVFI